MKASEVSGKSSQSQLSLRLKLSQAKVRSTTHLRGRTTNPRLFKNPSSSSLGKGRSSDHPIPRQVHGVQALGEDEAR